MLCLHINTSQITKRILVCVIGISECRAAPLFPKPKEIGRPRCVRGRGGALAAGGMSWSGLRFRCAVAASGRVGRRARCGCCWVGGGRFPFGDPCVFCHCLSGRSNSRGMDRWARTDGNGFLFLAGFVCRPHLSVVGFPRPVLGVSAWLDVGEV